MSNQPRVSIIIPNYNEKENIQRGVLDQVKDYLKDVDFTWEVILSDDASTDGSLKMIKDFASENEGFKTLENKHGGKAWAIYQGIKNAKGEIILFTDMDQSTPLKELEKLLPYYKQDYDVVYGSRGKARKNFPWYRQLTSWGFRAIRQIFLLRGVVDTQCGFKSMRRPIAQEIFPQLEVIQNIDNDSGWSVSAFDVELLFLAKKYGHKLKEVDVAWQDEDVATGKGKNFLKESTDMLKQILRVKLNDLTGKY